MSVTLLSITLLVPAARAHPESGQGGGGAPADTIGQRLALRFGRDVVEVGYVAEVPARRVYAEARAEDAAGPAWSRRRAEDLAAGLALSWDGAPLATEAVPVAEALRTGEADYLEFHVARRATLPDAEGTLRVRNANFPDEPCYFATEARVAGDVVVTETSLARVEDGRLEENRHGAWTRDEAGREPWIAVRPASFWERSDADAPLPERMAGLEGKGPPWWLTALLVLTLVPVAWLGRWLGRRGRRPQP